MLRRSKDWFEVEYFSKDEKNKQKILIDFRDNINFLWIMLSASPEFKGRPGMRKNGSPITIELFKQFLNLTLKFLYDSDSFKVFLDPYLKNFYSLATGDGNIESFIPNEERSFNNILDQLEIRKKNIERRLIDVDTDSEFDRVRLRGEIEGIIFAINTIKVNQ